MDGAISWREEKDIAGIRISHPIVPGEPWGAAHYCNQRSNFHSQALGGMFRDPRKRIYGSAPRQSGNRRITHYATDRRIGSELTRADSKGDGDLSGLGVRPRVCVCMRVRG